MSHEYLLANRVAAAKLRFDAISSLFDGSTFRHLEQSGIRTGWTCWEVGAGGATVVKWLAERVGPSGRVLATDIDVSWANEAAGGPVEVRIHDVARDEPPPGPFDLVHARLVLVHLVDRDRALASMVRVLAPGGVLVIEDADPALQSAACLEPRGPAEELANEVRAAFRKLMKDSGVELAYGRKLPRLLRDAGLIDVAADAYFPIGHAACGALEKATVAHIRDALVSAGLVSASRLEEHLANVDAGRLDLVTAPMISAWGRRPK